MKRIDVSSWKRREQYELFKSYRVPCYSVTARMDVTPLMRFREKGGRLFDAMLYSVYRGMSSVEEMRMRIDAEGVVLYERIYPVFTVALDNGSYASARIEPHLDYNDFSAAVRLAIAETKSGMREKKFDDGRTDDFYFSCVPTLDFTAMEQPISGDPFVSSVPMAVWGKMVKAGNRYEVSLQISVHHALVDGMPLAAVFESVQRYINEFDERMTKIDE